MWQKFFVFVSVWGLLASGLVSSASAEVRYTVTDLGALGWGCFAQDINNQGQIVGTVGTSIGDQKTAFLWENGVMTNLGLTWSSAYAINDSGQIAGIAVMEDGSPQAVLWGAEGVTYLGTLGGRKSWSGSMNNLGQIVGVSHTADDDLYGRAFLWSEGGMQLLEAFDGETGCTGINDSGLIVGYSAALAGGDFAVVWKDGVMSVLETDSGMASLAESVNQLGQIVGRQQSIENANSAQACLWQDGIRYDLESLADCDICLARDINNLGQIVGVAGSFIEGPLAVLWEDGDVFDLNDLISDSLGWKLSSARAINDHGQIVGEGYINGERHAVLLTPIPEPISLLFLLVGFVGLVKRQK